MLQQVQWGNQDHFGQIKSISAFFSDAGIGARVAETIAPVERDSEEDRSMDQDDARDYENQFPYPDDPDSPRRINEESFEILAAILKRIPECIDNADFDRLSHLLPHMEPVHVATRTEKAAIAVSY